MYDLSKNIDTHKAMNAGTYTFPQASDYVVFSSGNARVVHREAGQTMRNLEWVISKGCKTMYDKTLKANVK